MAISLIAEIPSSLVEKVSYLEDLMVTSSDNINQDVTHVCCQNVYDTIQMTEVIIELQRHYDSIDLLLSMHTYMFLLSVLYNCFQLLSYVAKVLFQL